MKAASPTLSLHHPDRDRVLAALRALRVGPIDLAAVTGSGLGDIAEHLTIERTLAYGEIDGFPPPKIPGHRGQLLLGRAHGKRFAIFAGRFHAYEGASGAQITLPVQIAAGLGARAILLTAAVGAINPAFAPGDLVLIADHLNLMSYNPLFEMTRAAAANPFAHDHATPFVSLTGAYRTDFHDSLRAALEPQGGRVHRGVLTAVTGPTYETPAEVRMLRTLGVDVVCMSTVPEAIYARYAGLDVAALTLVTNRANDGSSDLGPTHEEVLRTAASSARLFAAAVAEIFRWL